MPGNMNDNSNICAVSNLMVNAHLLLWPHDRVEFLKTCSFVASMNFSFGLLVCKHCPRHLQVRFNNFHQRVHPILSYIVNYVAVLLLLILESHFEVRASGTRSSIWFSSTCASNNMIWGFNEFNRCRPLLTSNTAILEMGQWICIYGITKLSAPPP